MNRDLGALSTRTFDLVVIGGGIFGAWIAWDAALRGLSVALLEQGDFGAATSANSQKIVHGGFRYLQRADLRRVILSARERAVLMRVAPHLVFPMPVLVPTTRRGPQPRALLRAALAVYDALTWDRNQGLVDPAKRIPRGRIVSREECLRLAPGLDPSGITGGAVWHDGQVLNAERLTLAVVRSAADAGACVANYVRVTELVRQAGQAVGVEAEDRLTGRRLDVRSRLIINAAGPWAAQVMGLGGISHPDMSRSKTLSLLTRSVTDGCAVSVLVPNGRHRFFLAPWRQLSLIGSSHRLVPGQPGDCRVDDTEIDALLEQVNAAYPGGALTRRDVRAVYAGLLPLEEDETDPAQLIGRARIIDHARRDGVSGLVSVIGVKYTTARPVAVAVVDVALRKLGLGRVPSRSAWTPVRGGSVERLDAALTDALRASAGLDPEVVRHLVPLYGSDYPALAALAAGNPAWAGRLTAAAPVIAAQVVYAVQEEMAQTISDVVFRRTELGVAGYPGSASLRQCAATIARELGWDPDRVERELDAVEAVFTRDSHAPGIAEAAG